MVADDVEIANFARGFADGLHGGEQMARRFGTNGGDGEDAMGAHAQLVHIFRREVAINGLELFAQLPQRPFDGGEVHGDSPSSRIVNWKGGGLRIGVWGVLRGAWTGRGRHPVKVVV